MERLTNKRVGDCQKRGYYSMSNKQDLIDHLAEYENTGLTPEQIKILQEENEDLILDNKAYVEENEKLLKRLTESEDE